VALVATPKISVVGWAYPTQKKTYNIQSDKISVQLLNGKKMKTALFAR